MQTNKQDLLKKRAFDAAFEALERTLGNSLDQEQVYDVVLLMALAVITDSHRLPKQQAVHNGRVFVTHLGGLIETTSVNYETAGHHPKATVLM